MLLTRTRSLSLNSRCNFLAESVSDRFEVDPLAALVRFAEFLVVVGVLAVLVSGTGLEGVIWLVEVLLPAVSVPLASRSATGVRDSLDGRVNIPRGSSHWK